MSVSTTTQLDDINRIDVRATLAEWYSAIENHNATIERPEDKPYGQVKGRINNREKTAKLIQEIITDIKKCTVDKLGKQQEWLNGKYRATRGYLAVRLGCTAPTIDKMLKNLQTAGLIKVGDATKQFPNKEHRTRCIQIKFICPSLFRAFGKKVEQATSKAISDIKATGQAVKAFFKASNKPTQTPSKPSKTVANQANLTDHENSTQQGYSPDTDTLTPDELDFIQSFIKNAFGSGGEAERKKAPPKPRNEV